MSKPQLKFQAWPAECAVCHNHGALVLCADCYAEIHISCGDFHECKCGFCGSKDCDGGCEDKPGYYDSRGWWVKD